jgi:Holliday junction DNA helicase RuvB
MAIEADRLVAIESHGKEEENIDRAIRPKMLSDYVGQDDAVEQLRISIQAAKREMSL